jgi:hypothetical protein
MSKSQRATHFAEHFASLTTEQIYDARERLQFASDGYMYKHEELNTIETILAARGSQH